MFNFAVLQGMFESVTPCLEQSTRDALQVAASGKLASACDTKGMVTTPNLHASPSELTSSITSQAHRCPCTDFFCLVQDSSASHSLAGGLMWLKC